MTFIDIKSWPVYSVKTKLKKRMHSMAPFLERARGCKKEERKTMEKKTYTYLYTSVIICGGWGRVTQ